jgi:hypothetical protein
MEGSVEIDGSGFISEEDELEDSTSENDEGDIENSSASEEEDATPGENPEEGGEQPPQKTSKGTKLADDPLQQANQLRANAEAQARQYEQFLQDPIALKAYLDDLEKSSGVKKAEEIVTDIDPDKLETVEDLRAFAKNLKTKVESELAGVKNTTMTMAQQRQYEGTANRISNDITGVQSKYPQLREKNADGSPNPDFDPVLDKQLGELYEELDFDPKTKMFKGQVSFARLADRFMAGREQGEKAGSQKAQTRIVDRTRGRIPSGAPSGSSDVDESKMSSSEIISSRIKRARARSRKR